VEHQMTWSGAHRRLLIDEPERPSRPIDRERADRAGRLALELAHFVHREQQPALRIDLDERRIRRCSSEAERHERDTLRRLGALGLQAEHIDAFALWSGISADVYERCIHTVQIECTRPRLAALLLRTSIRTAAAATIGIALATISTGRNE